VFRKEAGMRFYHRTTRAAADAILRDGFRDGVGYYLASEEFSGVWLANELLDENEGAFGDVVLLVEVPIGLIRDYEWIEEGRFLREWLVPATVLNGQPGSARRRPIKNRSPASTATKRS
jgi:hypothetical protein